MIVAAQTTGDRQETGSWATLTERTHLALLAVVGAVVGDDAGEDGGRGEGAVEVDGAEAGQQGLHGAVRNSIGRLHGQSWSWPRVASLIP